MWQLFIYSPLIRVGRSFVIKRRYSLVVIARTWLSSNLSLQPHTQRKNCCKSCLIFSRISYVENVSKQLLNLKLFFCCCSVLIEISTRDYVRFWLWFLGEIRLFHLLLRKGHQLVLFAKREWCVCISIFRILPASSRILLVLKVFLPPCKQPLNFQKPTSYRFHE